MVFEDLDNQTTLVLNALFAFLVAALYTFVGRRLSLRQVSPESQLAATMFSVWWFGLGAITLGTAVMSLMGAAGILDLPAYMTVLHILLIILVAALAGLVYYLAFLFTGSSRLFWPIIVFYGAYYVFLLAYITYSNPNEVKLERWGPTVGYANQITGPILVILLLATLLPVLIGACAYFSLLFRVKDRSQRYRIAMVGGTLTAWFSTSLVASFTGLNENDSWQFVSRLIGAAAALMVLWAYDPPLWIQRRLRVESVVPKPVRPA